MTHTFEIDTGTRCERHVGEAFPPRCFDCQAESPHGMRTTRATVTGILTAHHWDCGAGVHKPDACGYCVLCGANDGDAA